MPLDATRLAELIDSQAASLRLWIRSRCEACDDVVQEAFCRLAVQEPPPDNPTAWLYQVCRNLAEKQRRTDHRRRHREAVHAPREAIETSTIDPLELAEVLAAIDRLDTDVREILIARIWGGLSLDEVARLCGISTATAFRRYHAALQLLRAKLNAPASTENE